MAWTPIDGKILKVEQLGQYLEQMKWTSWKPIGMVLHNTGAPKLSQWDPAKVQQRIRNLEHYYKNEQQWSAGPHAFVDDVQVCLFTPFNRQGVHSPSFNGTRLGIEMVGDFETETIESGRGLKVYKNTVALFGLLHMRLGLDPQTIKLHREDPRTTHKCPGRHINKQAFINDVEEYMGSGGDHKPEPSPAPIVRPGIVKVPVDDRLNVRDIASAKGNIITSLPPEAKVRILSEAKNGDTLWLRVDANGKVGWVSGRYVER